MAKVKAELKHLYKKSKRLKVSLMMILASQNYKLR